LAYLGKITRAGAIKLKRKNSGHYACFVLFEKASGRLEPFLNSQRYLVRKQNGGLVEQKL